MEKKLPEILVSFVSLADVLPNLKNHYIFWSTLTNICIFHANKFSKLMLTPSCIYYQIPSDWKHFFMRIQKSNHSALLHLINSIWFPLFHHPLFTSQQCLKKKFSENLGSLLHQLGRRLTRLAALALLLQDHLRVRFLKTFSRSPESFVFRNWELGF